MNSTSVSGSLLNHPTRVLFFLILTSLSLTTSRADQFGDLTYETNGSSVTITGYTGAGGTVIVPAAIAGMSVRSIGDLAFVGTAVTSVTLPNTVILIGNEAFESCAGLTNVTIPNVTSMGFFSFASCPALAGIVLPNSLTNLGDLAFFECTALTNITIPGSVISIGESPFSYCAALTAITVDPLNQFFSSADGVLFDKAQNTLLQYPGGKLGSYTSPDSVTIIAQSAFYGCLGLTSVTLPGATSIGNYAFQLCAGLTSATLPNSLTSIGVQAFNFAGLTSVALPSSVTNIAPHAFAFTSLTSVTVPTGITHLNPGMFRSCPALTSLTLPNGLTSIGDYIFKDISEFDVAAVTGVYFKGNAPTIVGTAALRGANNATVYYRAGTTGWGSTFAGRPTALWVVPSYNQWAQSYALPTQYPAASGPQDDADHDGLTNTQEMDAGTDPTNAGSALRMENQPRPADLSDSDQTPLGPNQLALYFQCIPGKIYELQSTPALGSSWKAAFTVTSATTQKRVVVSKPISNGFYRALLIP